MCGCTGAPARAACPTPPPATAGSTASPSSTAAAPSCSGPPPIPGTRSCAWCTPGKCRSKYETASPARDEPAGINDRQERDVMAKTPLLERLTASDLFLLMWDDYGWSSDIGGLAVLDGAGLLDRGGRVRVDAVREQFEPRLHLIPRFRQLLYRPRLGLGWPLWVDAPTFDLADRIGSTQSPLPAARPSCWPHARTWRRGGWIQPGRYGNYGCCPACRTSGWARTSGCTTPSPTAPRRWPSSGRCWTRPPVRLPRPHHRSRQSPSPLPAGCWPTTCAAAGMSSADGGPAWPIRAGRPARRDGPCRRGARFSPNSPPHTPASTIPSAPAAGWPSSVVAWTSPSRSPTPTAPRLTTWCWPRWPVACVSCWPAAARTSADWCSARW